MQVRPPFPLRGSAAGKRYDSAMSLDGVDHARRRGRLSTVPPGFGQGMCSIVRPPIVFVSQPWLHLLVLPIVELG